LSMNNNTLRKASRDSHRHNTFPAPPPPSYHRYHLGYEYNDNTLHYPGSYGSSSRGGHYKYGTPFTGNNTTPNIPSSSSSTYYSGSGYQYPRYPHSKSTS